MNEDGFIVGATYHNIHNKSTMTVTNYEISDEGCPMWRGEKTTGDIVWVTESSRRHWTWLYNNPEEEE